MPFSSPNPPSIPPRFFFCIPLLFPALEILVKLIRTQDGCVFFLFVLYIYIFYFFAFCAYSLMCFIWPPLTLCTDRLGEIILSGSSGSNAALPRPSGNTNTAGPTPLFCRYRPDSDEAVCMRNVCVGREYKRVILSGGVLCEHFSTLHLIVHFKTVQYHLKITATAYWIMRNQNKTKQWKRTLFLNDRWGQSSQKSVKTKKTETCHMKYPGFKKQDSHISISF